MSEKTIKEIIWPQKFSSNGIRIDELDSPAPSVPAEFKMGYRLLFNFFVEKGGFGYKGVIYATDIAKLNAIFKGEDGKISLEGARKMGLQGKDEEIQSALDAMDSITMLPLTPQESYPIKIDDQQQLNYNKDGKLESKTFIDKETKEFEETVYENGDAGRIIKRYIKKADGTLHFIEYNPHDLSKVLAEAINAPSGVKIKRVYSYDHKSNLKSYYESGANYYKTTLLDEQGRIVFVYQALGHFIKRLIYTYDDVKKTVMEEIEGDPRLLSEGILRKKLIFETVDGKKTDNVLAEANVMMNGELVLISGILVDNVPKE
jgi:hypothetical protein